jgi:hypothetical protein
MRRQTLESQLLQKLADKSLSKADLYKKVVENPQLLPEVLGGLSSSKAAVRYGCSSVLMNVTAKYPEKLYPHFDTFVGLLDSKYRILTWNATAAIANLCTVDADKKFDAAFDKYFSLINSGYLVTVANVVGNAGKIASAKPILSRKSPANS